MACAVVREDPPVVFVAKDIETLNWIVALKLVAATPAKAVSTGIRDTLRSALLEERWGDAVSVWIDHKNIPVDVYPALELYMPSDIELAAIEMQFMPLFSE